MRVLDQAPTKLDEQVGLVLFALTFLVASIVLAVARRLRRS